MMRPIFFLSVLAVATVTGAIARARGPAEYVTTLVGPPETVGNASCCMFDSPLAAVAAAQRGGGNTTLAYTANSRSWLFAEGAGVDALLEPPLDTGLGPGAPYSACGKWLNSVYFDEGTWLVHGYFHQEWQCDYARGGYTNKSVGYAVSSDGGVTFVASADQLIAGANTTAVHQVRLPCVVRVVLLSF